MKKEKEKKSEHHSRKKKDFIYMEARTNSWKSHVTIHPV